VRFGGTNDSRTDTSTIADGIRQLGEFSQGDEIWNQVAACVKKTFEPFNITITETDPGPDVPHFENMVGGRPTDITDDPGLANAGGVAPFDCGEISNAIVYTFDIYGPDADHLCWTSAQEIAHAFGLEHQFLQKDPLTYLDGDLPKRFRDETVNCGEYAEKDPPCQCGVNQNSYRKILALFGPGTPTPPDVLFKRLTEGKVVQPGFSAVINAIDDVRIDKVELFIDGDSVGTTTTSVANDFEVATPDLALGAHTLEARATDVQGIVGATTITVEVGPPCTPDKGCTGDDVCVEGVCIPGPGEPGGIGSVCQRDTECLSRQCADAGEELKYCVEDCTFGNAASCPNNFECITGGASGVCWPTDGGGCCDTGGGRGNPFAPLLLGLGVLLVLARRRTRG
jgi:hypothetical protein